MKDLEVLKRFLEYCEWQKAGKSPHIEASRKYGLSIWEYFDDLREAVNATNRKADELTVLIEVDGFDLEGLRRQGEDEKDAG
ncbi:MAG: hypothetical protein WC291_00890 [Thermodesulfovibrionales bacterium]